MSQPPKKRWLSPTAINTYLRCPRKFYLRYIKKLKSKPSIHLYRGMAVHEALAEFQSAPIAPNEGQIEKAMRLKELFQRAWQRLEPEMDEAGIDKYEQKKFHQESTFMLDGWLRNQESSGPFQPRPKAEVKAFSKKHMLMGFMDAVFEGPRGVVIVDYKTSKSDRLTPEIERQLYLYALLYQDRFGKKPFQVMAEFLKTGAKRGFVPTQGMIDHTARLVTDIHQKTASMDESEYPCECGGWCERDFIHQDGGEKP